MQVTVLEMPSHQHRLPSGCIPQNRQGSKSDLLGSSAHGSVETNLTSIHEDACLIPGLAHWVRDQALP